MEWTYGTSGTLVTPSVGVRMQSSGSGGSTPYLVEYVTVTSGAESSGNWFELPYQGGYTFKFIGSGGAATLSDAGFFISPTQIPLDNLNLTDAPPPNAPGSLFTPQPALDGFLPGGIPEPATWAMMLLGVMLLGVFGVGAALRQRGPRIGVHA